MLALTEALTDAGGDIPAISVLSAQKVYPDGTRALAAVDLAIAAGEFVTLIGPSGCGKSTLLKLMATLIAPSDGRLEWWRAGYDALVGAGHQVGFVFQDPTLMPWARVEANVRLPLDLAGMPKAKSRARVRARSAGRLPISRATTPVNCRAA